MLTGASGYVGGRLLHLLENMDVNLRCLARIPSYLEPRTGPETEVVKGDLLDIDSLTRALQNIDIAYYLVHSMNQSKGFQHHLSECKP